MRRRFRSSTSVTTPDEERQEREPAGARPGEPRASTADGDLEVRLTDLGDSGW